jgi:hypothetical protein
MEVSINFVLLIFKQEKSKYSYFGNYHESQVLWIGASKLVQLHFYSDDPSQGLCSTLQSSTLTTCSESHRRITPGVYPTSS